jgi:hypothetical protein
VTAVCVGDEGEGYDAADHGKLKVPSAEEQDRIFLEACREAIEGGWPPGG